MNEQQKIERLAGLVYLNSVDGDVQIQIGGQFTAYIMFFSASMDIPSTIYSLDGITSLYTIDQMINLIVYIHANLPEKGE